ncbi:hypothetical protein LP097_07105 [Moraxella bovis]|uniref:alpha/beta hydrolase n=1 Tax=Moraxella bovis TaxID=476 RepID=UPI002226CD3A|nr:hypothetical protein [Moraxella bovis]UZA28745.1 hypothetical protein LP097_07105 [Moraxella bovis]
MKNLKPTTLILAPHMGDNAVLEVDAHWANSDTLAVILHPNPKAGGTMNNKVVTTLYRFCKENGMDTVRFNYRGVGRSSGEIEYGNGEYLDSLCVLDWALQQTNAKTLWLAGFSFGDLLRAVWRIRCWRITMSICKNSRSSPRPLKKTTQQG